MKYLALLLSLFLAQSSVSSELQKVVYKRVHTYTHVIYMRTILDESTKCSATAIGPHALLTASHCELPVSEMVIDDNDDTTKITGIIRDDRDHTIYVVDATFATYAAISPAPAAVGDEVFLFGNPGRKTDVFRKGYVAAIRQPQKNLFGSMPGFTAYDLNGYEGDSGAGVFNDSGELVDVVSLADISVSKNEKDFQMKLLICLSLSFTPEQLEQVTK